jgi:hypothetical protein
MKYILSFVFTFLIAIILSAQITITQDDMPSSGDTIRTSNSVNFGMINFEETGEDFTWDFSMLTPFSQDVDTFVNVSQTPWLYQLMFLTSANLAQKGMEFDQLPGYQVSDYYDFYKNSSSGYKFVGFGVTLNGLPIPNKYDEADMIYKFPIENGNVDSSMAEHGLGLPSLGYFGGWKKRVNHADGYGTIITPYGTFETLRIKSTVQQYDSIYIDSLGFGIPMYQEYIEYKWLGNDFGIPLCTVRDDGLITNVTYIDSVRNLTVGLENFLAEDKISIYPNPAQSDFVVEINLIKPSGIEIQLFDLTGILVNRLLSSKTKESVIRKSFDLHALDLSSGLYFIVIKTDLEIYTKKLTIH